MDINKLRLNNKSKLELFKEKEQFKSDKRKFRTSLKSAWMLTMTKKITWICLLSGILDLVFIQILTILSSPSILSLDSTVVTSNIDFCGKLWIGVIVTIGGYFIRGFVDSYSVSKNGDVSELKSITTDEIKEKAEEFVNEVKEKIL